MSKIVRRTLEVQYLKGKSHKKVLTMKHNSDLKLQKSLNFWK